MIKENPIAKDEAINRIKQILSRPREGIHVSDLLYPRKYFFRLKHPDRQLNEQLVGFFVAGRGHHGVIEALAADPEYREIEFEKDGIHARIDIWKDKVIEIKTTRIGKILTAEDIQKDHPDWIRQLSYYCAMLGEKSGQLWVFYLGIKDGNHLTPRFQVFDLNFDSLLDIEVEMLFLKIQIMHAVEKNDPSSLPPCPEWMCRNCLYQDLCEVRK